MNHRNPLSAPKAILRDNPKWRLVILGKHWGGAERKSVRVRNQAPPSTSCGKQSPAHLNTCMGGKVCEREAENRGNLPANN